ncbi:hypothetical protein KEF29_04570 [Streptomyces tuirus]|uniref:Uncharacterized protein n=1 Tax=Streptomyces tuirus TaxID=68278 RepID=A0A941FF43_9ACTN|nr:hypothetical protein [Streptomyces tuirus]
MLTAAAATSEALPGAVAPKVPPAGAPSASPSPARVWCDRFGVSFGAAGLVRS